jgi:peptide-methionine (S)-S-oxide reductase
MRKFAFAAALVTILAAALSPLAAYAEPAVKIPAPDAQYKAAGRTEIAVLAGGCFWGIQAVYQHIKGV